MPFFPPLNEVATRVLSGTLGYINRKEKQWRNMAADLTGNFEV